MDYIHLYRLSKQDLISLVIAFKPHLKGSLYKCSKKDLVCELKAIISGNEQE